MRVSITKSFRLMLYRLIIAVFCLILNAQTASEAAESYSYRSALRGQHVHHRAFVEFMLVRTNIDTLMQTLCVSCGNSACAVCNL